MAGASSRLRIVALAAIAVALHAPVFMGPHLGEQDVARLVNDALLWQRGGIRQSVLSDYRYFISPGYIWLVRALLPICQRLQVDVGYALNGLNLIAAALVVGPLYRLFSGLLSQSASWCAILVLMLIPTFWQAGLYGFPHLPAMLFMLVALTLLERVAVEGRGEQHAAARDAASVGCLTAAILLKADVYLTVMVAPLLFFRHRPFSITGLLRLAFLVLVPVAVSLAVAAALVQDTPNLFQFAGQWNTQYSPDALRLVAFPALGSWLLSFGFATLPVAVYGVTRAVTRGRASAAVLVSVWLLAPLVFWSSRPFDSARHHFQAAVPAGLGVGLALDSLPGGPWVRFAGATFAIVVNYWAFPPSDSTAFPSGNLLASARRIKERVAAYETFAEQFAAASAPCQIVLGTNTNPYVDYAVLRGAERIVDARRERRYGFDTFEYVLQTRGVHKMSASAVVFPPDVERAVSAFRAAGYNVASLEYALGGEIEPRRPSDAASHAVCRSRDGPPEAATAKP